MDKNIFLIGMPGAGKSYWGKKIATATHKDFFDLDIEIENREQKSIVQIFREHGEKYFRQKESEILKTFEERKNIVLATGGGTPCFYDNMNWLKKNGMTIWIDEPIDLLRNRLLKEKSIRPLIHHVDEIDLTHFLKHTLEERIPFFSKATIHLKSPVNLVDDILNKIKDV